VRRTIVISVFLAFLAGCSAYKELTPDPEIFPTERGYIELKNGKDQFTLDKESKYFMKFPSPDRESYVLVLRLGNKPIISSHLTTIFDNGDSPSTRIRDEAADSDTLSVYAIDGRVLTFFWVVDTVRADTRLTMHYRYMPRWRYAFEARYTAFQESLRKNAVDRSTYESIGPNFGFESFDFSKARTDLDARASSLSAMREELVKMASLFPSDIAGSRDSAYQKYVALKAAVDDELRFQEDYAATLRVFELEKASRGNTGAFLEAAPLFADFLGQPGRYRQGAVDKARELVVGRLPEASPYYENQLKSKNDLSRITLRPPFEPVRRLFAASGQPLPDDLRSLEGFVDRFNVEAGALQSANSRLAECDRLLQNNPSWASDTLYAVLIARNEDAKAVIVESQLDRFERQRGYPCVALLNQELSTVRGATATLNDLYSRARSVAGRISMSAWPEAEAQLRELHTTVGLNENRIVRGQKPTIVAHLELEIFTRVKKGSEQRVDAFITRNEMNADNVPALYADSAFLPLHRLTFSGSGPATVAQRNKQIQDYLMQAKTIRFPETAINALYRDFVQNINNRGAEKARAIVEHGKQYLGSDKQVKAYVTECDPTAAKWIVKPKEYRKVYALPITANRQGSNDYLIRLRLNIPSGAQFPVFDITIKLPPDVAAKAGSEQWYRDITINKKPIKNEGRFRITSPRADNNYESLISPVQMDKEGNNILEVRFAYPGYRAFEISAMAQVPIIRKN
jgi:hypothetical protein